MTHTRTRLLGRMTLATATLAVSLTSWAPAFAGDPDLDPDVGQSWLQSISSTASSAGASIRGVLRATDDFGVVRDREFRLDASGSVSRGDRRLDLRRAEPECPALARQARMTSEEFCDRLTVTRGEREVTVAFSSYDANRIYSFTLAEDPRTPGFWASAATPGVTSPELSLQLTDTADVQYQWKLRGERGVYSQSGSIASEALRSMALSGLEASFIPLGDVLRSFNSLEFMFSDLPRSHPNYQPTPYSDWGERPFEDGCVFVFCFGDLGGGDGGGGSNSGEVCNPESADYDASQCYWDLTYATWPASQRVKIWKINNDEIGYFFFLKNDGKITFESGIFGTSIPPLSFVSLIRLGESQPLVLPGQAPYGDEFCFARENLVSWGVVGLDGTSQLNLQAGGTWPNNFHHMFCPGFTGRPAGRYRLYLHIDPFEVYDWPGKAGNNIGDSGPLDWVNLKK